MGERSFQEWYLVDVESRDWPRIWGEVNRNEYERN